jgi:hypothetical protein
LERRHSRWIDDGDRVHTKPDGRFDAARRADEEATREQAMSVWQRHSREG